MLIGDRELESHLANRIAHERQPLNGLEPYLRPVGQLIVDQLNQTP